MSAREASDPPAALYLAAAGVGTIGIIDFDAVDVSNLQRQILHGTPDVGRSKLQSGERLNALNPTVKVESYETALTSKNALELFKECDIILDGTDNFSTRYLVNDACVILRKPNAYGSIFRFEGQASVFATKGGPCYRCLYPEPPPPGWCRAAPKAECSACCRRDRNHPGDRIHQAAARRPGHADRPAAALRRLGHALPRAEAAARPRARSAATTPPCAS